jgi:DNA polymerase III epsilon subunit-like protein
LEPKNFSIIEQYETFIKPYDNLEISKRALEVSRVSMEEINNGLDHKKALQKIGEIFKKHSEANGKSKPILVGHNFSFDIKFLEHLFELGSKDLYDFVDPVYYCTMRLMKMYERKSKKDQSFDLTSCCNRFGIKLKAAHGALNDCIATRDLWIGLMKDFTPSADKPKAGEKEEVIKSRRFFELP